MILKISLFINIALFLLLSIALITAHNNHIFVVFGEHKPFDVATLVLGAATVVLTGVAVIVAVVALWGYNEIKDSSIKAARKIAKKEARDVAVAVATRVASETAPFGSTAEEAEAIVESLEDDEY